MKYELYSHRYGLEIIRGDKEAKKVFEKLEKIIQNINEDEILDKFIKRIRDDKKNDKSISIILNETLRNKLLENGWEKEVYIFKDKNYSDVEKGSKNKAWRLDFAYPGLFSLEVAFNHSSAALVNLMKPVLASEINHVQKALDGDKRTKFGIVITAKSTLQANGGFDGAIGTYEKYIKQLKPHMNFLITPTVIIGLEGLENYLVEKIKNTKSRNTSTIVKKKVAGSSEYKVIYGSSQSDSTVPQNSSENLDQNTRSDL
ncbi:hypothetical protein [Rothia nasimurium]|uniref:hypothetical protein n=1 Tax=Rothia nasimurium TaxID=85336 RepID=UPI001F376AF3|nr:hypothetical protein [Rothia nasimurium]